MNFFDTVNDKTRTAAHTMSEFIKKEKDLVKQAWITIFFLLIVSAAVFAAGWAFGYNAARL